MTPNTTPARPVQESGPGMRPGATPDPTEVLTMDDLARGDRPESSGPVYGMTRAALRLHVMAGQQDPFGGHLTLCGQVAHWIFDQDTHPPTGVDGYPLCRSCVRPEAAR